MTREREKRKVGSDEKIVPVRKRDKRDRKASPEALYKKGKKNRNRPESRGTVSLRGGAGERDQREVLSSSERRAVLIVPSIREGKFYTP